MTVVSRCGRAAPRRCSGREPLTAVRKDGWTRSITFAGMSFLFAKTSFSGILPYGCS